LSLLGAAFAGICILFIAAFIWFQPDQLSLSDRYFPSPTVTPTPTTPNRLTVTANGSHFTFLINDQLVANATDTRIPRGTTGLAIQIHQSDRQATFEFDNFELREP